MPTPVLFSCGPLAEDTPQGHKPFPNTVCVPERSGSSAQVGPSTRGYPSPLITKGISDNQGHMGTSTSLGGDTLRRLSMGLRDIVQNVLLNPDEVPHQLPGGDGGFSMSQASGSTARMPCSSIMVNMTAALCVRKEGSRSPHLNTVLNPIVALAKRKNCFLFANSFEWYVQCDGRSSLRKRSILDGGYSGQAVLQSDLETESTSGDEPLCNTLEQHASTVRCPNARHTSGSQGCLPDLLESMEIGVPFHQFN